MDTKSDDRPARFAYFADPACIAALIIYPINRFILKPHHIGGWFTHGYLNDVLCLPLFVPVILYVQRLIRLRPHDGFPTPWEIFQAWAAFSIMFQVIIPRYPKTFTTAGDPYDMIAYLAGGLIAGWYWSRRNSTNPPPPDSPSSQFADPE